MNSSGAGLSPTFLLYEVPSPPYGLWAVSVMLAVIAIGMGFHNLSMGCGWRYAVGGLVAAVAVNLAVSWLIITLGLLP